MRPLRSPLFDEHEMLIYMELYRVVISGKISFSVPGDSFWEVILEIKINFQIYAIIYIL